LRDLIVVGAGQSALETAVLAAEAGAQVRVAARGSGKVAFGAPPWRQPKLRPESPFGRAWSLWALGYYPHPYRHLPAELRHYLVRRVLGPLGAWWLKDRFAGKVQVSEVARVIRADSADGRPSLTVRTPGGRTQQLSADHVIAATGYRVDLAAMDFLGHELRTELTVSRGTPRLGAGCVSSVPGAVLHGVAGGGVVRAGDAVRVRHGVRLTEAGEAPGGRPRLTQVPLRFLFGRPTAEARPCRPPRLRLDPVDYHG
jgi:FAD-dependent urate hydroxylase